MYVHNTNIVLKFPLPGMIWQNKIFNLQNLQNEKTYRNEEEFFFFGKQEIKRP